MAIAVNVYILPGTRLLADKLLFVDWLDICFGGAGKDDMIDSGNGDSDDDSEAGAWAEAGAFANATDKDGVK